MSHGGWAALPRGATGCLQFVIVVFPDHTHLLFLNVAQYVSCKVVLYFFMFTWELEVLWQLSSQNEVNIFILLEVNCKINSLGGAKIPYFVYK